MSGLAPKLRFQEFKDEWDEKELNEIALRGRSKNADLALTRVLTNSAIHGVMDQSDYFDKDIANANNLAGYYIVQKGDFVYNPRISISAPVGPIKRNDLGDGVMSPLYTIVRFKSKDTDFYYHFFQSSLWHEYMQSVANYGARHDRMAITADDFMALPIPQPSLPEQRKIADFLSSVDAKIDAVKRKLDALERYKKGLMQQIFSQKIRFKQDDGSDFPEWEEKRLGEIGSVYGGLTGKSADDFGSGVPFVTYMQIFKNSFVKMSECAFVKINDGEKQNRVAYGDVLITTSSETPQEVGYTSVLLEQPNELYLNSFSFGFRANDDQLLPELSRYLFRSSEYRIKVMLLAQGSTRYNISKSGFLKISLNIPSLPEQQKIADFLSSVDAKIDVIKRQVEKLEAFKKGLLQQMFV